MYWTRVGICALVIFGPLLLAERYWFEVDWLTVVVTAMLYTFAYMIDMELIERFERPQY